MLLLDNDRNMSLNWVHTPSLVTCVKWHMHKIKILNSKHFSYMFVGGQDGVREDCCALAECLTLYRISRVARDP